MIWEITRDLSGAVKVVNIALTTFTPPDKSLVASCASLDGPLRDAVVGQEEPHHCWGLNAKSLQPATYSLGM